MPARICMRMGKSPFTPMSLEQSEREDVIGSNSGNMLFAQSVYKTLTVPGVTIGRLGYTAAPGDADLINDQFDLFVAPFANALRLEWIDRLDAYTDMISRLRVPVTIVGIGTQTDIDYDLDKLRPIEAAAKRFMAAVLERSATVGVRGECTAAFLKKIGFGADVVDIVGCPSMFMYGQHLAIDEGKSRALTTASRIAINVTSAHKKQTFRSGLDVMLQIADRHVRVYPHVIVVPQESRALTTMMWGEWLGRGTDYDGLSSDSLAALRAGRARFFVDPNTWFAELATRDFSFGTRLHGNVAALLGGTPAVMLATDSRTREIAELFGIPWRRIDHVDATLDAARLAAEADYSTMLRRHAGLFDNYAAFLTRNDLPNAYLHPGVPEAFEKKLAAVTLAPMARGIRNSLLTKARFRARAAIRKARRLAGRSAGAPPAVGARRS